MQAKVESENITGRNKLVLTKATISNDITAIPGADGNDVTVAEGSASKFTATANTTYAYVYTVTQKTGTEDIYEAVKPANGTDVTSYYRRSGEEGSYTYTQATGIADGNTTYYDKYTTNNGVYAVKVIKVTE